MVAAAVTSVCHAPGHAVVLAFLFAGVAIDHAARPSLLLDLVKANVIIRKISVELIPRVSQFFWNGLSAIHGRDSMPFVLLVVKG